MLVLNTCTEIISRIKPFEAFLVLQLFKHLDLILSEFDVGCWIGETTPSLTLDFFMSTFDPSDI